MIINVFQETRWHQISTVEATYGGLNVWFEYGGNRDQENEQIHFINVDIQIIIEFDSWFENRTSNNFSILIQALVR